MLRAAARFVTRYYRQTTSVTSLIQNLGWTDLKTTRKNYRFLCMLKILNELVEIPINDRLIPADKRTLVGTIRPLNTSELTPHWDKILFGIKLSLIDWNFLPAAAIESKTVAAFKSQLVD